MADKKLFAHPDSVEREYTRLLLRYSKQLQTDIDTLVVPMLGDLIKEFQSDMMRDSWSDTLDGVMGQLNVKAARDAGVVIDRLPGTYTAMSAFNERQFKLVVKANTGVELPEVMPGASYPATLGVNVYRDEPFLRPLARGWVSNNTQLIKSLPVKLHPEIEGIIRRGVMNGNSVAQLQKDIKEKYKTTDYRAKLIAQDQINKGNADLTRYRLDSVGVKEYIWRNVGDNRVRPEHVEYEGHQYAFDKPPPDGNPGQPVRCRCRAEAVWDDVNEELGGPLEEPRPGTAKATIFGHADNEWETLGKPTDLPTVLAMRKRLMTTLEQLGIPKTTSSVTLGEWQKARVGGGPGVKATIPAKPVPPPTPAPVPPAAVPKPKKVAAPKADPMTVFDIGQDPWLQNQSKVTRDWHETSYRFAPKIIKDVLLKSNMDPNILTRSSMVKGKMTPDGAWCAYGRREINMPASYSMGNGRHQSTWRHEVGHYMDGAVSKRQGWDRSSDADFKAAFAKDRDLLLRGHQPTVEVMRNRKAEIAAFDDVRAPGWSLQWQKDTLRKKYADLGMDFDLVEEVYYKDGAGVIGLNPRANNSALLRMAHGIESGDAEEFVRGLGGGTDYTLGKTFDQNGGGNVSDIFGSITSNKVAGHRTRFGHDDAYYADGTKGPKEVYANFFALYGTEVAPGWAQILPKLLPNLDKEFRKSLEEYLK